jgi:hypothetical protein
MAETSEIITQVVSGILTGGAGAATSLLGVFKKTKARLAALEELVGKEDPVKTGIFLTLYGLEETVKRLKREVESWEDSPPMWAERLFARARSNSSSDISSHVQFEETVNRSLRSFNERLSRAEDDFEAKIRRMELEVERELAEPPGKLLSRDEFTQDSRMRAEEMLKLREQLATVNGMLRGVMTALGIIDPDPDELRSLPKLPPRSGR